jgi:hypothetical protein
MLNPLGLNGAELDALRGLHLGMSQLDRLAVSKPKVTGSSPVARVRCCRRSCPSDARSRTPCAPIATYAAPRTAATQHIRARKYR